MNKDGRYLFNLIYFVFVFTLTTLIGNIISLDINIFYQVLIVLIFIFFIKFSIYKPFLFPLIILLSSIVSFILNRYISFLPGLFNRLGYLFENIIQNLRGRQEVFEENIILFWLIILFIVSIFTCFFIFKKKKPWLLFFTYMPVFSYYWYTFYNEALFFMAIFLISFIGLVGLNSYARESRRLSSSPDYELKNIYPNWRKTIISYAFIIVVIAGLIPKNSDYISWPWLSRRVTSAFPIVEEFRASEKNSRRSGEASLFDFSNTGFMGENSRLGGPVELSDKKVMTVLSPRSIYLRGNVLEEYSGFNWMTDENSYESYNLKDDFSRLTTDERLLYYRQEEITITNELFSSTTIFSPYRPYKVFSNDSYPLLVDRNHAIKAPDGVYKDENYLVRLQSPLAYGILKSKGIDMKKSDLENLNLYLALPDNISQRTRDLTREIVSESETDFDKAVTIENFLRTNFPYNLQVEEIPDGWEFVDYFLFEGGEGYCTYYASAMAIMLRIEGIPTRYIEGYLVKDRIDEGKYEVRQRNAHAWVEAYIEPVGWMTFEATPAFELSPRFENYNLDESRDIDGFDNSDIALEDFQNLGRGQDNLDGEIEDDPDLAMDGAPENESEINYQYTLATVLAILLFFFFLNISRKFWNIRKEKKLFMVLSKDEKIKYLYKDICKIISKLGYEQKSGETHFEYADRVNYKFYGLDGIGIRRVTEIFVSAKYSDSPSSEEDFNLVLNYKHEMENRLKNHLGKFKYYYLKYIRARL